MNTNKLTQKSIEAINRAQIPFASKEKLYRILTGAMNTVSRLSTMEAMVLPEAMKSVVRELLLAE